MRIQRFGGSRGEAIALWWALNAGQAAVSLVLMGAIIGYLG